MQVSRRFWQRLFEVHDVGLRTLQEVTATPDPADALLSNTGHHGNHHALSQELKDTIAMVLIKFLAATEDHYVPQERVAICTSCG